MRTGNCDSAKTSQETCASVIIPSSNSATLRSLGAAVVAHAVKGATGHGSFLCCRRPHPIDDDALQPSPPGYYGLQFFQKELWVTASAVTQENGVCAAQPDLNRNPRL